MRSVRRTTWNSYCKIRYARSRCATTARLLRLLLSSPPAEQRSPRPVARPHAYQVLPCCTVFVLIAQLLRAVFCYRVRMFLVSKRCVGRYRQAQAISRSCTIYFRSSRHWMSGLSVLPPEARTVIYYWRTFQLATTYPHLRGPAKAVGPVSTS